MFANPLYSVAILLALVGVYIIIRIKHGKPLFQAFSGGAWLDNWIAWLIAFRTWVVTFLTGAALALPDLIVQIAPIDLSPLIGEGYSKVVTALFGIFVVVNNVILKTKPDGVKAA